MVLTERRQKQAKAIRRYPLSTARKQLYRSERQGFLSMEHTPQARSTRSNNEPRVCSLEKLLALPQSLHFLFLLHHLLGPYFLFTTVTSHHTIGSKRRGFSSFFAFILSPSLSGGIFVVLIPPCVVPNNRDAFRYGSCFRSASFGIRGGREMENGRKKRSFGRCAK